MTPFIIGNIQFTFSLLVYGLIAAWYIHPRLKVKPWQSAVLPLLLIHAFRYGPLTLLMPGQVDASLDMGAKETIAYGDLISAVFAIGCALAIKSGFSGSKALVWVFSIVGILDIAIATKTGIEGGALEKYMGFNLYILNFYVPMLIVSHVLIIKYLLKPAATKA